MDAKNRSIEEPGIISARTYFWEPCEEPSKRRKREKMMHNQIKFYLEKIGFEPRYKSKYTTATLYNDKIGKIDVVFQYYEDGKRVQKIFEVYRNGKLSNIRTLRKLYPEM